MNNYCDCGHPAEAHVDVYFKNGEIMSVCRKSNCMICDCPQFSICLDGEHPFRMLTIDNDYIDNAVNGFIKSTNLIIILITRLVKLHRQRKILYCEFPA